MTETEVLETINKAIENLAVNFQFGYYDKDDMMQEGVIFAMEALPRFDPNKASLEHFIRVHVRNRFILMHRDKMERKEPPCTACPESSCPYAHMDHCPRCKAWEKRNQAKRALVNTFDNNDIRAEHSSSEAFDGSENLVEGELVRLVESEFPVTLRADYRRFIEGVKLPKHRREKVLIEIRKIARSYNGFEER
jgi:DNA-directed RNA polymerase specialized sigma24 family protein